MLSIYMKNSFSPHRNAEAVRLPAAVNLERFLAKLMALYRSMDDRYQAVADHYGFECRGCEDNCCRTHFHHHTLLEFHYLAQGYRTLDPQLRHKIYTRAKSLAATDHPQVKRTMCPLNFEGRCVLYRYRPMICRLHGLPHELRTPGSGIVKGSGCDLFKQQCGQKPYKAFDRTPVYQEMAQLEQALRQKAGNFNKIKLTVAEIILALPPEHQTE